MAKRSPAVVALDGFLVARSLSQTDLAVAVGVTVAAASDWFTGRRMPSAYRREVIERWTGGVIPAPLWLTSEQARDLKALKPFAR